MLCKLLEFIAIKVKMFCLLQFFSLDPDQKEQLIDIIEKLLKDKSTVSIAAPYNSNS